MTKFYFFIPVVFAVASCGTAVNYMGASFNQTAKVDVYVDAKAIKKSYTVIGKGYELRGMYGGIAGQKKAIERLQEKAVAKAKLNGADAVLFEDYFLLQPGTNVHTTTTVDTLQKSVVSTSNTHAGPVLSAGRNILFLKYN